MADIFHWSWHLYTCLLHQIRNAQHLNQWKANRNQAVVRLKSRSTCTNRQSLQPDRCHNTDKTRARTHLLVKQYTQNRAHIRGRRLMPIKYCNKPQKTVTVVHSPYASEPTCHKTKTRLSNTERPFDQDDPTLVDCYSTYQIDIHFDDRQPTQTQQCQEHHKRKARRKLTEN